MDETLSSAELTVMAAALGSNASPWIEDSTLLELDRPILARRLAGAREGLELRGIAESRPDGSLRVLPPYDGLLQDALSAAVGFELQLTQAGGPAERLQAGMASGGWVVHRWLAGDEHLFYRAAGPAALEAEVMGLGGVHLPARAEAREYVLPRDVMEALARQPAEPEEALRAMLAGAGVAPGDVNAILRSGLAPRSQCVFWSIGLLGTAVQARVLMWFSDAETSWLIANFDASGQIRLQAADEPAVRRAVNSVIAAALQPAA